MPPLPCVAVVSVFISTAGLYTLTPAASTAGDNLERVDSVWLGKQ
jgi:hypothetical protein